MYFSRIWERGGGIFVKNVDVGVIKFFIFEWVLVLVFVCKWDGGVWWCIDICMLNSRLVKDVFFLFLV